MQAWPVSVADTLDLCGACLHVQRDMARCRSGAREHAWGGVGAFDRVRCALTRRSLEKKMKRAGLQSPLSILDIGFGSGLLLKGFVERGEQCRGIEAELLEVPHAAVLQEKAALIFGTAEEADFGDGLDLIYAVHVIEHLQDPQLVFEKCFAALKPGGMVYFMTPNGASGGLKLFKSRWWNLEDPTHIRFFSKESVTHMLQKAGFKDISVTIPRWDSLTLEANSVLRILSKSGRHGVLDGALGQLATLALFPLFLLARLPWRNLSPSIEITARKK